MYLSLLKKQSEKYTEIALTRNSTAQASRTRIPLTKPTIPSIALIKLFRSSTPLSTNKIKRCLIKMSICDSNNVPKYCRRLANRNHLLECLNKSGIISPKYLISCLRLLIII
jgi:hypothetical protein